MAHRGKNESTIGKMQTSLLLISSAQLAAGSRGIQKMLPKQEFCRWFNRSFWNAFKDIAYAIEMPSDSKGRQELVEDIYESIASKRYSPSIPETELFINKGNGVTRTVPVFCIRDYCVYYFCIKELEDVLCVNRTPNTFGGWSLGGKLRKQEQSEIESELTEYGRYSFNPMAWTRAFGEFSSILFSQLDEQRYSHVLQFDLSNFYDSVRLDTLERWIREEASAQKGWIVTLLFYLLNQWNRGNTGLHPQVVGLPQDALADCSRILANFYLQKYDRFARKVCNSTGSLYLRYADDQVVLTNNPACFETVLLLLTKELDRYGLRVNQKKVEMRTATELETHRCRKIQSFFAEKGDNQNPILVKSFARAYLEMTQDELKESWNQGLPLLNRLLHSNLECLPTPTFEKIVRRFTTEAYLCRADHRKLARVADLAKISTRPKDMDRRLRKLLKKSVHNAFHNEVRAFAHVKKKHKLVALCASRLKEIEKLMNEAGKSDLES
jgi:hypothetical protein